MFTEKSLLGVKGLEYQYRVSRGRCVHVRTDLRDLTLTKVIDFKAEARGHATQVGFKSLNEGLKLARGSNSHFFINDGGPYAYKSNLQHIFLF